MYGCSRIFQSKEILAETESLSINMDSHFVLSRKDKMFDQQWVQSRFAEREAQTSSDSNQSSEPDIVLVRDLGDVISPARSLARTGKSSISPLGIAIKLAEDKPAALPDEIEYLFHDQQGFEIFSALFWGFTLTRFEINRVSDCGRYLYDNIVFHRGHAGSRLPLSTESEAYNFLEELFSTFFFGGLKLNFHWKYTKGVKSVACDVSISTPIEKLRFDNNREIHRLKQEGGQIILY